MKTITRADLAEAIYTQDPDRNGVELYRDRSEDEWPRDAEGRIVMYTRPLDLNDLVETGRTT